MAVEMNQATPPVQIGKELELVKRYVLLGVVSQILDHDIRIVGAAATKLPRLYESMMRGLQDRVLLELAAIRRQFRACNINLYQEKRTTEGLTASYSCMGYQHHFSMPWTFVKAEAERLLRNYLAK
ncbi:hypothetical protein A8990_12180 [Paenibacillus taihuensis]|uniref:Uncharacterized protein n=1 Tax=Paenibacillus taihuensis TaxID=1156355 RepID=A0A3D9RR77_9BACL|nr:hypothetical protein [Paenibacillus taihuensis]REE80231.1 hypothetical protein A8990_12180 [Paenibacillus taihuensis]